MVTLFDNKRNKTNSKITFRFVTAHTPLLIQHCLVSGHQYIMSQVSPWCTGDHRLIQHCLVTSTSWDHEPHDVLVTTLLIQHCLVSGHQYIMKQVSPWCTGDHIINTALSGQCRLGCTFILNGSFKSWPKYKKYLKSSLKYPTILHEKLNRADSPVGRLISPSSHCWLY